jgi:transposase
VRTPGPPPTPRPCAARYSGSAYLVKKSLEAAERDERQREEFRREAEAIARRRLVFTDETGFHLAMTRHFGRAPRGERVRQRVPRRRGTNVTLIGALALRGWIAALSFSGPVDREAFDAFVTELLVPRLRHSDVVLLDNLRVHHASSVEDAVRSARARVLWLPPYSPDFSPLEDCWSKVKAVVRGKEPRSASDLDAAMTEALGSVTAADVDGWFRHCGY